MIPNLSEQAWVSIVVAVVAGLPGILAFLRQRRREKADVTARITEAAGNLVDRLDRRLKEAEATITFLEDSLDKEKGERTNITEKLNTLRQDLAMMQSCLRETVTGVGILNRQLEANKIVPAWSIASSVVCREFIEESSLAAD